MQFDCLPLRAALKRLDGAIAEARAAAHQASQTLSSADSLTGDPGLKRQIDQALNEIMAAARSIHILADSIERQPDLHIRARQ